MSIKIIICALCLFGGTGAYAGIRMHGGASGSAPVTACAGATNDLVFSNNCSGVYYPQMLK